MVLSGALMLNSSAVDIIEKKQASFHFELLRKNLNASISFDSLIYSFDYEFDEGAQFKKVLRLSDLDHSTQQHLKSLMREGEQMMVEKVYQVQGIEYNVYYFDQEMKPLRAITDLQNLFDAKATSPEAR